MLYNIMPKNIDKKQETKIKQFEEQKSDRERIAYNIAIQDLQTSLDKFLVFILTLFFSNE